MNFIDDLPFYLVIISVSLNILIGLIKGTDLTTLMLRSIFLTIVFTIFGLTMSKVFKNASDTIIKKKENSAKEIKVSGSTIDIKVPPESDEELINFMNTSRGMDEENDDEFQEINPAYLHNNEQ